MKKLLKRIAFTAIVLGFIWLLLTLWVEQVGSKRSWELGNQASTQAVLIVYDPDPFYNLDEQVSRSFGQALADHGLYVRIATVATLSRIKTESIDNYVFCTNTYNWRPDWAVRKFITQLDGLAGKPVVAITVGAGSTEASQKVLEKVILDKKGLLLDSRSFWLSRPNDEARLSESNSRVAVSMAYSWGERIAERIKHRKT